MKKLFVMFLAVMMLMLPAAQATEIGGGLNTGTAGTTEETPAQTEEAPGTTIGGGLSNMFGTESAEEIPAEEVAYTDVQADGDWYYQRAIDLAELLGASVADVSFMDTYGPGANIEIVTALSAVDYSAPAAAYALMGGSMDISREKTWEIYNFGFEAASVFSQWVSMNTLDSASYMLEGEASDINLWVTYYAAYPMPAGFEARIIMLDYGPCCVGVQFIDGGEGVIAEAMIFPTSAECTMDDLIDNMDGDDLFGEPELIE